MSRICCKRLLPAEECDKAWYLVQRVNGQLCALRGFDTMDAALHHMHVELRCGGQVAWMFRLPKADVVLID